MEKLTRWTALSGGIVLSAVIIMSCLSIAGRALGSFFAAFGPVQGDQVLVQMGMG